MTDLQAFLQAVIANGAGRLDQFAELVWFNQSHGQRETSIAHALDTLEEAGMPRQNRTRFKEQLSRSRKFLNGRMKGTVRLSESEFAAISKKHEVVAPPRISASAFVVEGDLPQRKPLLAVARQVNACYALGFYDACASMARRLVEMLLIEVYLSCGRPNAIKNNAGQFMMLENLITTFLGDSAFAHGRNLARDLGSVKAVGDTASHDRTHITSKADLDGIAFTCRRCISALVALI